MKKTALALLLALLMAAALLNSGALASDDEAGPVAKVGNVEYDNFNDAMKAVIESETTSWLDLLRDVTVDDAQYVIDSSVQIDANGYTLTLNAPEDEDACIFTISKGCFLEISSAELVINGNGKGTVFKAYGPAYTDTRSAVLLTASDVYISNFENVFDFEKTDNPKSVSVYGSSLNITNISGSVSNGGNWGIDSNVNISNCTGSGFTADFLGLYRDSSMTVSGIGSSGIVTGGLNVAEYSSLTVSGCGSELPIASAGAPSKSGYIFLGWSYNGSTYAPGDVVPIDGPMTVKAVWGSLPSVSEPEETPAEPVTPAPVYTDVSAGDWYYEAVEYVSSEGLMDGVSEGEFAPGATLTRAMVWTILARDEGRERRRAAGGSDNPRAAGDDAVPPGRRAGDHRRADGSGRGEREQLG